MHSAAFALACLFTLQLPSERFSLPPGAVEDTRLFLSSRVKRQGGPTACLADFGKLQSNQECLKLLEDLSTTSNLQTFCSGGCGAKLKPIFTDLVKDCATSGTLPVGLFKVFEDGCKMNSNGTYCLVAISKIFSDVQSASSFENCFDAQATSTECTTDCRTAVSTIVGVAGCCEGDLEMFLSQSSPNIKSKLDQLWDTCSISKPAQCP
jgi:hypothetical protein